MQGIMIICAQPSPISNNKMYVIRRHFRQLAGKEETEEYDRCVTLSGCSYRPERFVQKGGIKAYLHISY